MNKLVSRLKHAAIFIPLTFFAIIISWQYRPSAITADGHTYLQIARNIHYGIGLGWQALWASPLHSMLIALIAYLPGANDLQYATDIVSILMGGLLTVSLYFLATLLFDRKVGVMATIVVLSFPQIVDIHFSTEPEITYTAFLFASLALLVATVRNNSYASAILAGISFSLAYLSRSEGFLIMAVTLAVLCGTQGLRFYKTKLARLCLTIVLFFFIASSPYLHFLKKHYGAFTISPKATYVMIWMKSEVYHDNDKRELANDDLWGLTPEGKLKWQQPSGLSDLVKFLMSHPAKSLSVYLHNLATELPGRIPNSSGNRRFPQVYPIYIAVLALIAAFLRWGDDSSVKKAVVFSPLFILLILPVFTGGWSKYLLPYAPLLIIAACGALSQVTENLGACCNNPRLRRVIFAVPVTVMALLSVNFLSALAQKSPVPDTDEYRYRLKLAGYMRDAALMARGKFGPGHNYMVNWNKMIYYLDGLWTPFPIADTLTDLLDFARRNNVDYIVRDLDDNEIDMPDSDLFRNTPPGLKLAGIYRSKDLNYAVSFYEVLESSK